MPILVKLTGGGRGRAPQSAKEIALSALERIGVTTDADCVPGETIAPKPSYAGLKRIKIEEGDTLDSVASFLAPMIEVAREKLRK